MNPERRERIKQLYDEGVSFLLNVGNIGGRVMRTTSHWPRLAGPMNIDLPTTSIEGTSTHT